MLYITLDGTKQSQNREIQVGSNGTTLADRAIYPISAYWDKYMLYWHSSICHACSNVISLHHHVMFLLISLFSFVVSMCCIFDSSMGYFDFFYVCNDFLIWHWTLLRIYKYYCSIVSVVILTWCCQPHRKVKVYATQHAMGLCYRPCCKL